MSLAFLLKILVFYSLVRYLIKTMNRESSFDRLVQALSTEERQTMLDRIRTATMTSDEPLVLEEPIENYTPRDSFARLGFWKRFFCFLKALFTGTDKYEIVEELDIQRLAKDVEKMSPSVLNYGQGEIGIGFYDRIAKLEASLTVLRPPLRTALGGSKEEFVAFYVGWIMPLVQEELLTLLDPEKLAFERSLDDPFEVKRAIESSLKEYLGEILDNDRKRLYQQARALSLLKQFVDFPFSKLLQPFTNADGRVSPVAMNEIRGTLFEFDALLYSLEPLPDDDALKAVFMFDMQKDLDERDFNPADQLLKMMDSISWAWQVIRQTAAELRVNDLCRIVSRNLNYQAESVGGGEDWFQIYRKFWQKRCDAVLGRYIEESKRKQIIQDAVKFLKKRELPLLDNYRPSSVMLNVRPRFPISLSFIASFVKELFLQELHSPLKLILIDGQFYKEQNREEYNESYSGILKVVDDIAYIDSALAPDGALQGEFEQLSKEVLGTKIIRKKVEARIGELDREADRIINGFEENLRLLANVIGGIVDGEMGGRFDTLSNLGYIGKNDNSNLMRRLKAIKQILEKAIFICRELYDIERNLG